MSNALLSSKVIVQEEAAAIPSVAPSTSGVACMIGVAERGPIADATLVTSFAEYTRIFGGFTTDADLALGAYLFFQAGGSFLWVVRTCHFTDLADRASYTATKGTVMRQTAGTAASPGIVTGTGVETFILEDASHLDISINGAGAVACAISAAAAILTDTAVYPIAPLAGGETMGVTVAGEAGGAEQTITAVGGETTAADIAALINNSLAGQHCGVAFGGQVRMTTDEEGSGAAIQVTTGGTLNAILGFPTTASAGTGNVSSRFAITGAEIEAIVEAAVPTCDAVVLGTGAMRFQTVATGAAHSIQIDAGSSADFLAQLNIDTLLHSGADATPENTLAITGKTPGAYTDAITTVVSAASSGVAGEFNLAILVNGVTAEVFPNLTMGDGVTGDYTQVNYVETVVNHTATGSKLVAVTDQLLAYVAASKRPADGTSAALSGGGDGLVGLVDTDYLGNAAGPTGVRCFDVVDDGQILVAPNQYSNAVLSGLIDYAELTRGGLMFCVLDCPPGYTAAQMVAWMASAALTARSEYACVHWPRVRVANPSTAIYGSATSLVVPTAAAIAGKLAANDAKARGGIYESPAGTRDGWGVVAGVIGVEDDPAGASQHQVLNENVRDLVYPLRINPIRLGAGGWYIDGGRTLLSSGNFPNIAERRGVIAIENAIKTALEAFRHRNNTAELRRSVYRMIQAYLIGEMNAGAFRSTDPATAFFVDVSDALNPPSEVFAGRLNVRIGLATNKPAEFIILSVTQDVRGLAAELA